MVQDHNNNFPIPERWLLWTLLDLSEYLNSPLLSTESKEIKILYPGISNHDNGPDLLGAVIEVDNIRYKGDIEFHINQKSWFKHGHDEDQRYRNVVLHILWDKQPICNQLVSRFHHLILSSHLKLTLKTWREKMLQLEKHEPDRKYQKCRLNSLSSLELERLAKMRFRKKIDRFKSWIDNHSFDDVLYISLAETLGYSKNKTPFRLLFYKSPPFQIFQTIPHLWRSPLTLWTFLSFKANFLNNHIINNHFVRGQKELKIIVALYNQFKEQGYYPSLKLTDWYFSRMRPANNPILRMAAIAQILFHYQSPSLFQKLLYWARMRLSPSQLLQKWRSCLQFEIQSQLLTAINAIFKINPVFTRTMGDNRFGQFAINGILPIMFLWAHRTENFGFSQYLEWLYEEFPTVEDKKFIKKCLPFLPDHKIKNKLKRSGFYQQGFIEFTNSGSSSVNKREEFLAF
jgi:hypothetical protein